MNNAPNTVAQNSDLHPSDSVDSLEKSESARSLRFLFAPIDRFPPFRVDVDVLFGKELRARGHTIDWLMQAEEAQDKSDRVQWGDWHVYLGATDLGTSLLRRFRKHMLAFLHDMKVTKLIRAGSYDFVQVKDKFLIVPWVLWAARRTKTPMVFWLSYPFQDSLIFAAAVGTARYPLLYRIRGHFIRFVLFRLVAKYALHIVVQSEQMKRDLIADGIPAEKMTPVPMGVEMYADDKPAPVPVKPLQMIYVGTLLKTRRMDFLVRVLAEVLKIQPDAKLLMVGPEELPGDMEVLHKEAERLGVTDSLVLTGRLPREEAFALVRESAVCFSPFYPTPILNSTSPTKLVEYFSQSRPVIANDHPEQKLLINLSGAGFCVPYEEEAFAQAALKLMADPKGAGEMGERGYDWVLKNRSYSRLAEELEQSYISILDDKQER